MAQSPGQLMHFLFVTRLQKSFELLVRLGASDDVLSNFKIVISDDAKTHPCSWCMALATINRLKLSSLATKTMKSGRQMIKESSGNKGDVGRWPFTAGLFSLLCCSFRCICLGARPHVT